MDSKSYLDEKNNIEIHNKDGLEYLSNVLNNSIDLILTDPPYITSRSSGMNTHYNNVKENKIIEKTETEWIEFKQKNNITDDSKKENYIKYGSIYGTKYCVKTDYGEWDSEFTIELLEEFIKQYYKKLRKEEL